MAKLLTIVVFTSIAVAVGVPLGILFVLGVCSIPVLENCGGHEHAGAVYLFFWVVGIGVSWLALRKFVNRWVAPQTGKQGGLQ